MVGLLTSRNVLSQTSGFPTGLGCAIIKDLKNENYALMHGGGGQGVACVAVLLPESKQGLVVLTNGDKGNEICNKILTQYLDCGEEILSRVK